MREIQPGWSEILRITWLLIWRAMLGGFAMGFVLGIIVNMTALYAFGTMLGSETNLVIGLMVAILWWPQVVRMALRKRFKGFRLALVATET
jgi:hypothetical protein